MLSAPKQRGKQQGGIWSLDMPSFPAPQAKRGVGSVSRSPLPHGCFARKNLESLEQPARRFRMLFC
jgi:hypothetical protein